MFICFSSCAHCLDFACMFFLLHCLLVVFCWCSSAPLCYALLFLVDFLFWTLLIFVGIFSLCFLSAHLCFIVAFYWCLLSFPCCVLVVLVSISLLCFVDACLHPPCYTLLVLIDTCLLCSVSVLFNPLLCFVDVHWHILVLLVGVRECPLMCFIGVCLHLFVVLCWCSIDICQHPLVVLYRCLLVPLCYALILVVVGTSLLILLFKYLFNP